MLERPLTNQIHLENEQNICVIDLPDGNKSIIEHLHKIFSCQNVQTKKGQPPCIWSDAKYPIF